jgi:hypothetical protein
MAYISCSDVVPDMLSVKIEDAAESSEEESPEDELATQHGENSDLHVKLKVEDDIILPG